MIQLSEGWEWKKGGLSNKEGDLRGEQRAKRKKKKEKKNNNKRGKVDSKKKGIITTNTPEQ